MARENETVLRSFKLKLFKPISKLKNTGKYSQFRLHYIGGRRREGGRGELGRGWEDSRVDVEEGGMWGRKS